MKAVGADLAATANYRFAGARRQGRWQAVGSQALTLA
jgi:hypothetical protein